MAPHKQHIRVQPVEARSIDHLVGRDNLARNGLFDRGQHEALAGGDIGQLDAPHAATDTLAFRRLNVEHGLRAKFRAEDGFVRAMPGHRAAG